ncbi:hypothetical protein K469DRAFT_745350 [Zopfia rhizophila CBS 207.26]|uniref:Uncharacterized protein n=1 Tax=Zopfia rhizophila CBS 207.26 TaxID=1314779 RepID=A0A6A6ES19_9PEZI|nr:hypothetical protein K469DRAFT_745350 [Zopfia rhizophila CBS 207.26]
MATISQPPVPSVSVAIRSDTANQVSMSRDAVGKYWLQNLVSVELPGAKLPREYLPAESNDRPASLQRIKTISRLLAEQERIKFAPPGWGRPSGVRTPISSKGTAMIAISASCERKKPVFS